MIYLHKILPLLISPLTITLFLICLGALKKSRKLILSGAVLLYLSSTPYLADRLFRWVEEYAVRLPAATMPTSDAIVVLGGMLMPVESSLGTVHEWADPDRFLAGIELFQAKKADKLVFTNSWLPWMSQSVPEGILLKQYAIQQGIAEKHIYVTENVQNTKEEAIAVEKLLGKKTITLVTSAYHMPRSKLLFEQQGFSVIPFPVDFKVGKIDYTLMTFLPSANALYETSSAMREMIGMGYYQLRMAMN